MQTFILCKDNAKKIMQRELKTGERYFLLGSQDVAKLVSLIAENGLIEIVSKISESYYSVKFVTAKKNHLDKEYIVHLTGIYVPE